MRNDLITQVLTSITRHRMIRAGDRVGVGVSGGSDSVALLRILHREAERLGIRLTALHFNHGLRGSESDEDECFVADLALQFGIPFFSGRKDVARVARARSWNLEDAARRLRYEFLNSFVAGGILDCVAVGHTADDQAETLLARLVRGTGPPGLAAIYPVNGPVVRPLLEIRRVELRDFLTSLRQPWREDATNSDTTRLRSRLRHRVLPLLESEVQPRIVEHLSRAASLAREDEAYWRLSTRTRLRQVLQRQGESISIRCSDLMGESPRDPAPWEHRLLEDARLAVSRRLVRGIVEELRGHCRRWTADHVDRVIQLGTAGLSGSRIELPGISVERSFDRLWFSLRHEAKDESAEISSVRACSAIPDFSMTIELGATGELTVVAVPEIGRRFRLKVVDCGALTSDTKWDKRVIDRDLLGTPLVLRNWHHGDVFRPIGRRTARKLKHFLRIKKVPVSERRGWPVLTSADDVVWARGLPVAAEFAMHPGSRRGVLIMEDPL